MSTMLLFLTVMLAGQDDPSSDAQALQILARAAQAQRGAVALPRPETLHGLFFVTARKQDGSGSFSLEVERHYLRSPERMLTRRTESVAGSDSTVGFDGEVFWQRDNRSGEVSIYSDDEETFHTDLALEQDQLQLTRLILDVLSVDGLKEQLIAPRVVGRQTINVPSRRRKGDDREVDVLRARMVDLLFEPDLTAPPPAADAPPPLLDVQIFIDVDTHFVHRVLLSTLERADRQVFELVLSRHAPNASGLVVPSTIRVLDERGDVVATLGLIADDEGLPVFELGQPIDPLVFERPAPLADSDGG